jgi:hypothetical protein
MTKKGGAGVVEGLWAGTAVFAALKARSYTGFLKSFAVYALILIVILAVGAWVLKGLGITLQEKFSVAEIQCQKGETPTDNCYGEKGCLKPSGACYKLLTTQTAPSA